jgi:inner membrane protein YidH
MKSDQVQPSEGKIDLGLRRTIFASERTLMAWIRTSLSMIGFGFTIYKFFEYLPKDLASGKVRRPEAPRNLAMTLIALGILVLVGAVWQHWHFLKEEGVTSHAKGFRSLSIVVAILIAMIGVIAFYGVLWRSGPF